MDRDGRIEVTISEDGMTALATFFPAVGEGRLLDLEFVVSTLDGRGVVYGLDHESIADVVFDVNTSHHIREEVPIASGDPPRNERPSFYRVFSELQTPASREPSVDKVDYRQVTRLPVVHEGQTIAKLIPPIEGTLGRSVRGDEIPFTTDGVEELVPGKNTRVVDDAVLAEIGGQLQFKNGEFFVEDRLEISGEVGYETGSIEFPGDIVLKGEVRDGFHVWAGGNISAAGTVDVSEVYCRGDFESVGGLVGRGRALLRAGGRINARFVGNCYIESKSSILVKQYIYNSYVGALGELHTGDKGRIIGGVVTAVHGARCAVLGNDANALTTVRVGINFIIERRFRIAKEKHEKLSIKLQQLLTRMGDNPSDRQVDVVHKIEEARNQFTEQMGDLGTKLDADESAQVIVTGDVFPGVQIQICRAGYVVEEKMKRTAFRLDKETGRIIAEPIDDA